jgi:superoxide dismutase, Fe-Mn family
MYTLPTLSYESNLLEPYISQRTIEFHYGKHHQGYVNKLNELLSPFAELQNLELEDLLKNINQVPENIRQAVFNNAGQVFNHNLYWESISPKKQIPTGELADKILDKFESFEKFNKLWEDNGISQFGSGWVWLSLDSDKNLLIEKSSNADNPIFHGRDPILTMDIWEHAYYLDYQNNRLEYIRKFIKIIDWQSALERYQNLIS